MQLTKVLDDLDLPVFATSWPDNPNALVVIERGSGIISTFVLGTGGGPTLQSLMLDLSGQAYISTGADQLGVTGFAFHPDFLDDRTKRFVYVRYNEPYDPINGTTPTRIERYRIPPGTVSADPSSATLVYDYPTSNSLHGSGQIHFDTAGTNPAVRLLYFGLGDEANPGDCPVAELVQDDQENVGKMWLINVEEVSPPALPPLTMFAKGLRNPFGFSVDRGDGSGQGKGDVWIGNTGPDCPGDIFRFPYGASGVRNYAWPWKVGDCTTLSDGETPAWKDVCQEPSNPPTYTLPDRIVTRDLTNNANDALIGGYVYRGTSVSAFTEQYVYVLFGNSGHPRVMSIDADDPTNGGPTQDWSSLLGVDNWNGGSMHGIGQDADGELCLIRVPPTNPTGGKIYRIDP